LIDQEIHDKATYQGINLRDEARKAGEYVNSNPQEAIEVAMGLRPRPENIHPQAIFEAVRQYALKTQDVGLVKELARSPLLTQRSYAGQTLAASQGVDELDPVRIVQGLNDSRRNAKGGLRAEGETARMSQAAERYLQKYFPNMNEIHTLLNDIMCK
jgi:hypothetical protein